MKKFLRIIDLPRAICCHVFGEKHTANHRSVVGGIIMVVGVGIAKAGEHLIPVVSFIADFSGYAIHAAGFYPILERLVESIKDKEK